MPDSADTELLPIQSDPRAAQGTRAWLSLLAALVAAVAIVSSLWRESSLEMVALAVSAVGFFLGLHAGSARRGRIGIVLNAMLLLFVCGYLLGQKG